MIRIMIQHPTIIEIAMDFIMSDVWFLFAYSWNILFCYVVTDDVLLDYQRECLQSTFSVFSHSSSNKYWEDSFLWGILNKKEEGEFIRDMKGQLTL